MSEIRDNHLLWIDLETTGSSRTQDCIIEVGVILTTSDLTELGWYDALIRPTDEGLGRMLRNPVVREMHTNNGLLNEILNNEHLKNPFVAGEEIISWATDLGAREGRTVIAGSGVGHFDKDFIHKFMPNLGNFCRHWLIDVGSTRRQHEMWVGTEVSKANDSKTHRAIDDVRCHLDEARAYRDLWCRTQGGADVAPRVSD